MGVPRASGGVTTYVSSDYHSEELLINSEYEVVCVVTNLPQNIAIVNIYNTNTQTLTSDGLQDILDQIPHPCIILTDLNAHNVLWGSQSTDRRGKQVETFLNNNNLILLNTGAVHVTTLIQVNFLP